MNPSVDVVLFDLGGVLIELGGVRAMGQMAGLADDAEVWERWLTCRWVRDFERGRCDPATFAAGVVADWGLSVGPDEFLVSFARWPVGLYEGAVETVARLCEAGVAVGCPSNTNQLHFDEQNPGACSTCSTIVSSPTSSAC